MRATSNWLLATVLGSLLVCGAAQAEPCSYEVFEPRSFQDYVLDSLPVMGMTAAPPELVSGVTVPMESSPASLVRLVHANQIVAVLAFVEDPNEKASKLVLTDADGNELARAAQENYPCGESTCSIIRYSTAWTASDAFAIRYSPIKGVIHELNGQRVEAEAFRAAFHPAINQVMEALKAIDTGITVPLPTAAQRLRWSIATDYRTAAYSADISIYDQYPRVGIGGQVPTPAMYNLLVSKGLAAGYTTVTHYHSVNPNVLRVRQYAPIYTCQQDWALPNENWNGFWWPSWPAWVGWTTWPGWSASVYEP